MLDLVSRTLVQAGQRASQWSPRVLAAVVAGLAARRLLDRR
jgi:hypothetical protein